MLPPKQHLTIGLSARKSHAGGDMGMVLIKSGVSGTFSYKLGVLEQIRCHGYRTEF